jgi:hypothetical protein
MWAIVMRHGKVDFQWKKWSTSEQFNFGPAARFPN